MKNPVTSKNRAASLLLFAASLAFAATIPARAHHGGAYFDTSKIVTLTGTVAKFQFINPHILISVDAEGANGEIQHWLIEYYSPVVATRHGWTRDMIKPGDHIIYQVHPAKNGRFGGAGARKMIVNGKTVGNLDALF